MTLSRRARSQRGVLLDGKAAETVDFTRMQPAGCHLPPGRNYSDDGLPTPGETGSRGLTGSPRPLYSAGFATPAYSPNAASPCGGIGRRARLKIEFRKECWFDSGQGHQAAPLRSYSTQRRWRFERAWAVFYPKSRKLAPSPLRTQRHQRPRQANTLKAIQSLAFTAPPVRCAVGGDQWLTRRSCQPWL
jgi:hypothetical protein